MQLQGLDLFIIVIIALSTLTGLFRGLVKEVIALIIWVTALWVAYSYSASLVPWLQTYIENKSVCTAVSFILMLFSVLLSGGIFNALLGFILKSTGLSGTDKLLGMVFGLVRGVFIVSLIIAAVQMTSLPYQQYTQGSLLYGRFMPFVSWISGYLPELINHIKLADIGDSLIDIVPEP